MKTNPLSPNGVNHLALSTSDMRKTLLYFNEALGFPLQALYWMHAVKDTVHGFLKVNDSSLLAFVYHPKVGTNIEIGKTHPGSSDNVSTRGTMHHLSFSVDSADDLVEVQHHVRARGITCSDVASDGFLTSIEFPGPDGMLLEVCHKETLAEEALFDLEAAAEVGLDPADIEKLRSPESFTQPGAPVPNVPLGEDAGFHLNYPPAQYRAMVSASDQLILEATKDEIPPTKKQPVFRLASFLAKARLIAMVAYYAIVGIWRKS